ncbi:MAG: molybdopterin-dependent oxidoreductase [Deltaproteobacteria bacterium]|nr:molybdopterin-dependent oxidoreductase [Deltaproteobacteria bacterium]
MSVTGGVGQRIPRIDAEAMVTGKVCYAVDLQVPGMLVGKIVRSRVPHGRIVRVDTSRAEQMPGVRAVITGLDMPDRKIGLALRDATIVARHKVRYVGEPVAAVAAVDERTAEEAAEAIDVVIEELPAVFDPVEGAQPKAPVIHEELGSYGHSTFMARHYNPIPGTNIAHHYWYRRGDVEAAYREAALVHEETFRIQPVHHGYMEPHVAVANVEPYGRVYLWSNTQRPFEVRKLVAEMFGWPEGRVRLTITKIGGGFGGKITPWLEPIAVALSARAGAPVKITLTRAEDFVTCRRQGGRVRVKSGVAQDGTLLAREVEIHWDSGAFSDLGVSVSTLAAISSPGPYRIPNVKVNSYLVYTNKVVAVPYRGLGVPEVMWAAESHMDSLAHRLGLDPIDIRMKNLAEEGDVAPWGEVFHSIGVKECLRRVKEVRERRRQEGDGRGWGVAVMHKFSTPGTMSEAVIRMNSDGTLLLLSGAPPIGQGCETSLAQIAAEGVGVPVSQITVVAGDTDATPFDAGTFSSRVCFHSGNAVLQAAREVRQRALALAAELLEARPEDLEIANGEIYVQGAPDRKTTMAEVARVSHMSQGAPIIGVGAFRGGGSFKFDPDTGLSGRAAAHWEYGAVLVKVDVDRETGKIDLRQVIGAHDVGKAINPLTVEGQIEGAALMGIGAALYEEMVFDGGSLVNPNFMDYLIPSALEAPDTEPILVETPHGEGPFGAKGIGEGPIIAIAPAIGNAVYDATGVRIRELPLTPERVLNALEAQA